jgi:hypothetical protein
VKEARATFGKAARATGEEVATLVARKAERANMMKEVGVCEKVGVCLFVFVRRGLRIRKRGREEIRLRGNRPLFIPKYCLEIPLTRPIHFVCLSKYSDVCLILVVSRLAFPEIFKQKLDFEIV